MRLFGGLRKHQRSDTETSEQGREQETTLGPTAAYSRGDSDGAGALEPQDSATDPELLAAILESLKSQRARQGPAGGTGSDASLSAAGRFLCRNLSEADPAVAFALRQRRAAQRHVSCDGVSYFEGGGPGESELPLVLPWFRGHPPEVRQQVLGQLCNEWLQGEAESAGVINCVPGCTPQLVLNTQGDGNCLSHACSLGVWGVHDRDQAMRGAIRDTITHPVAGMKIKGRFELQLQQNGIPPEEWAAEWRRELSAFHNTARMSDRYLSDVHCFTLANVLRRPLLLYGDESSAMAGLTGIYLPLLWPPSACCREPVAVLFWGSHFSLLCTVEGEGPASPQLLPLCTRDGPLQVRFLSAAEARRYGCFEGYDAPLELLQQYMSCEPLGEEACAWLRTARAQQARQAQQAQQADDCREQGPGEGVSGEEAVQALGVRLSPPAPQALLSLLEAAFVQQTAALCRRGSSRRSSCGGPGGEGRRASLSGDGPVLPS